MDDHFRKWNNMAPIGLTVIGFGLSLLGEAIALKSKKAATWKWVCLGTLALSVVNTGISIFGDAVKERALYEMSLKKPDDPMSGVV